LSLQFFILFRPCQKVFKYFSTSIRLAYYFARSLELKDLNWTSLGKHLAEIIDYYLHIEYRGLSLEELATNIDVPEEYLRDYFDPDTSSSIGIFFLRAIDLLRIPKQSVFPLASKNELNDCMTSLNDFLTSRQNIRYVDFLKFENLDEFKEHVVEEIRQRLQLFSQSKKNKLVISQIKSLLIDHEVPNLIPALKLIYKTGSFELLDKIEDYHTIFEVLDLELEDLFLLREVRDAELFELEYFDYESLENPDQAIDDYSNEHPYFVTEDPLVEEYDDYLNMNEDEYDFTSYYDEEEDPEEEVDEDEDMDEDYDSLLDKLIRTPLYDMIHLLLA